MSEHNQSNEPMVEEDLLHEMVVGLVEDHDAVKITDYEGPGGKNLVIHCASEDRGRVIGKNGCNIEALRAYFRSYATFDGGRRLYVHIEQLDD
jgi:predicted RNA-binding protein YlqC (UPF0109 family)